MCYFPATAKCVKIKVFPLAYSGIYVIFFSLSLTLSLKQQQQQQHHHQQQMANLHSKVLDIF